METLDEYNKRKRKMITGASNVTERANFLLCPKCGGALYDSSPGIMFASNPPQFAVHCNDCGFKGYRV